MPSVLHLIATDARRGAESFGYLLAQRLPALGWRSDVLAVRSAGAGQLPVESLGRSWHDVRGLGRLRQRSRSYDIVLAHGSTTLWSAALTRLSGGPPFVYVNIGDPLYWAADPARRRRVSWLLRGAAHVVALTPTAVPRLVTHLRVPVGSITVIPNGRSTGRFRPASPAERDTARRRLGVPAEAPVVAYVGALSPEKRPDLAVTAVAGIPGTQLLMAGHGVLRAQVEDLARREAPERIHLLGSLSDIEHVYWAADVVLLSSASEGVPGVLIEAALCGLAAVTTDVGFCSDVVVDGRTGRVVPSGDAAALTAGLVEALAQAAPWGRAARERAADVYDLDRVVAAWSALLRSVANPAGAGPPR